MIWLDEIRHQETAIAALREAHDRDRLAHAYLFWGPEGVGKTRAAQGFAQLLLCTAPQHAPCGQCACCDRVARFTHPDFHVLVPWKRGAEAEIQGALETYGHDPYECLEITAGATIGIERIRDMKLESAKSRVETGNRVIVIRAAEAMTPEAAQAALKLIEEPQGGTYLVLTCIEPGRLLPTIVSRCQRLRFRPLPRAFLESVLGNLGLDEQRARMIAGLARGSLGSALRMRAIDMIAMLRGALDLFERPAHTVAEVAQRVGAVERGWNTETALTTIDLLVSWQRDLLAVSCGFEEEDIVHTDHLAELRAESERMPVTEIRRRVEILEELSEAVERHVNPVLALQAALLRVNGLIEDDMLFQEGRG